MATTTEARKPVRCAIYTRKSTDEGLDQEFNSLDAQRLAGENFIASQVGEGWECLTDRYDDGGYTGGNVDRPALQRLLKHIEGGEIDCVVVYKVDRLSRSLLDFARIMGVFEEHGAAFVSVTQSFNSANSMGRLTLNILLSFAQFEREVISERTRDKIHMARKQGKWSGGSPVLGYDVVPQGGKIRVNPTEADQVRRIFAMYLELGTLRKVLDELDSRGWTNKTWVTRSGKVHQGKPFMKTSLHNLLTNPIYLGKVRHHGKVYPGQHDPIVDEDTFARVQRLLARNRRCGGELRNRSGSMLSHLLWCKACGTRMIHSYSVSNNRRYRYYVCTHAQRRGWAKCPQPSLPANEIESFVIDEIRAVGRDEELVRRVVEESQRVRAAEIVEKDKHCRLLHQDLDALKKGMESLSLRADLPTSASRLAALHERIDATTRDLETASEELENLREGVLTENEITTACREFNPVWDTLTSKEQWRLLMLVIERVEYDANEGTVSITFHPNGIKALNEERAAKGA
jgi:site-specific DNA recombinase